MLEKVTYQKKNVFLLIGAVLLLLIIYQFAIKRTGELYDENARLEKEIQRGENAPQNIVVLQRQLKDINNQLERYLVKSRLDTEYLLEVVSDYCQHNGLILREFPGQKIQEGQNFEVLSNVIVVEGGYETINKLIYKIEVEEKLGRVASTEFFMHKDRTTRRYVLRAKIYVQKLKLPGNELS